MQIKKSAIHLCFTVFFYSDDIRKTHQATNIKIPRKNSVFFACLALFLVFYSVNFVWCKICIFLVFYSYSRRQCQQIGAQIGLNVFVKRYKKHIFSRMFLVSVRIVSPFLMFFLKRYFSDKQV